MCVCVWMFAAACDGVFAAARSGLDLRFLANLYFAVKINSG